MNGISMVKQDIIIREATLYDVPIILHHRRSMFEEMGYTDPDLLDKLVESARNTLVECMAEGSYRGWVAVTREGDIAAGGGIVIARWLSVPFDLHPRRATILNMYTEPMYRRQGLARRLMNAMIDWCSCEGFGYVSLHASDDGRHLYETMGFKQTNEMRLMLK